MTSEGVFVSTSGPAVEAQAGDAAYPTRREGRTDAVAAVVSAVERRDVGESFSRVSTGHGWLFVLWIQLFRGRVMMG